jgi:ABC-type histidine transport system ATPase subunit
MILVQACAEVEPDIVCEVLVFLQFLADDDEMMSYYFVLFRHHLLLQRRAATYLMMAEQHKVV